MRQIIKSIIAPMQLRLINRHLCVACTRNLDRQTKREPLTIKSEVVICQCNRAYVYDRDRDKYRRAIVAEVRSIPAFNE